MAREKASAGQGTPPGPSETQITITVPQPVRGQPLHERHAGFRAVARAVSPLVLALLAVTLAVIVTGGLHGGTSRAPSPAGRVRAPGGETAAVARAFGYPRRCLTVTISAADPEYASAHVDHGRGCSAYHGYVNASFHRVDGSWRLVLDEGQLFVPNSLLGPGRGDRRGSPAAMHSVTGRWRG